MVQYFTKKGLEKLKEELNQIKTKEMRRITRLIAEAAAFGDLKENAAYHDARNMKSFLLGRIEQLESAINDAIVVEKKEDGKIQVGSEILILFEEKPASAKGYGRAREEKYQIVAPGEADILKNKLSYQSPLGQQLIGKKISEEFNYQVKDKKIKVKILEIK